MAKFSVLTDVFKKGKGKYPKFMNTLNSMLRQDLKKKSEIKEITLDFLKYIFFNVASLISDFLFKSCLNMTV